MAKSERFTIIDDGAPREAAVERDGDRLRLSPETLRAALGWELKPQGLCRAEVCVSIRGHEGAIGSKGVDLGAFAQLMQRPLAVDLDERVAALGASATDRARALAALEAPDFELPDLDGKLRRLSDHRGKKVLLVAYASW